MLLSMGLQRVRHHWGTKHMHTISEESWALESQGGNILESRLKKKKRRAGYLGMDAYLLFKIAFSK